ncbi:MAG: malonate decarboxylase subunit delta [Vulcanimicrobiaceae bacterium]
MIETLTFTYPASARVERRAHVGVVASGNCELLLEPSPELHASVIVRTSVGGYAKTWGAVLERFFARHPIAVRLEIDDFGATPAVVAMRLEQAVEQAR